MQKAIKEDGEPGLLIENTEDQSSYIMHKNKQGKVVITNTAFVKNKWKLQKENEQIDLSIESTQKGINTDNINDYLSKFDQKQIMQNQFQTATTTSSYDPTLVGSSLGQCLANINQYDNPGEFLIDFGSKAAVHGSLGYVIDQIPIFGTLLAVGGLGYHTVSLYEKNEANFKTKAGQFGKIALGTGTSVGSSISGALIGQLFIPVPFVGALVGGIIGGYLGTKTSGYFLKLINNKSYKKMILRLIKYQTQEGFWQFNDKIMDIYGMSISYFKSNFPTRFLEKVEDGQSIWISLISYTFLTIYYSEQDSKAYQKAKQNQKEAAEKSENQATLDIVVEQNEDNPVQQADQLLKCINWFHKKKIFVRDYLFLIDAFLQKYINEILN